MPASQLHKIVSITSLLLLSGCATLTDSASQQKQAFNKKVQIEHINELNEQGLYGPPDGLQALSYEFCIPGDIDHANEVMSIDPTLVIYQGSPGRIGCTSEQYLCVGHTSQRDYRQTLEKLAAKKYIPVIQETWFE